MGFWDIKLSEYDKLKIAARSGEAAIQKFIEDGGNINAENRHGKTALMRLVQTGNSQAVKSLLGNGANVNATDKHGNTALDYADILTYSQGIMLGTSLVFTIVGGLIAAGVSGGAVAGDCIVEPNHVAIKNFLTEKGGKTGAATRNEGTRTEGTGGGVGDVGLPVAEYIKGDAIQVDGEAIKAQAVQEQEGRKGGRTERYTTIQR